MKTKKFTFQEATEALGINLDGTYGTIRFGCSESLSIVSANGWTFQENVILTTPTYSVYELECENGTKYLFEKPLFYIHKRGFGPRSQCYSGRENK